MSKQPTSGGAASSAPLPASSDRFDHGTFWPMIGTALSGLALVAVAGGTFHHLCGSVTQSSSPGICGLVHANPPWLAMTGLISTPSILLTWYWRTKHRKRDLDQKDLEHAHQESESRREKLANAKASIARVGKEMFGGPSECASGLVALDRAAENSEVLQDVADVLCNFLRGDPAGAAGVSKARHDANRLGILQRVSALRTAHGVAIDLSHADLHGITLSNLDLSGANLTHANLQHTMLLDVNLAGAKLWRAEATNCFFDEHTISKLTEAESHALQEAGASRRPAGQEQVRFLGMRD